MKTLARTAILFAILFLSLKTINAQADMMSSSVYGSGFPASSQVELILRNAIPEYFGDLYITADSKYDKSKKGVYRDIYFKFDKAEGDVKAFELGAVDNTSLQILDYSDLKKIDRSDSLDYLKNAIVTYKKQINDFLKWDEKLAADSISVALYWTGYKDNLTAKNYDKAYGNWKMLFNNYPIISASIYVGGSKLVKMRISKTTDSLERLAKIDTLFMVYEQEIKAFPKRTAYVKGKMVVDFYNYYVKKHNLNDSVVRQTMWVNYNMAMDAIAAGGEKTKYYVFPTAMKLSIFEAMLDSITDEVAIDNYLKFSNIMQKQYDAETDAAKKEKIQKGGINPVDQIFTRSALSTCENLCKTFRVKFDSDPTNADNLKKILSILGKKECVDDPLYMDVAVALYGVEPSASSAYALALLYASKEEFDKSAEYFDKAIAQETVDTVKGTYYFKAAQLYNKQNQYSKAREYARKSFELRPNDGKPLILIATMYAATSGSVGADAFAHQCVYWAATDKLYQAKKVDPSSADMANQYINSYSGKFPKKDEGFFRSIQPGDSYTVGGWIGETTTARFND